MISGPPTGFEIPGFSGLPGGWYIGNQGATLVGAAGPSTSNMTWAINFLGLQSTPLEFYFFAYYQGGLKDSADAVWNGSWAIGSVPSGYVVPDPKVFVPEPNMIILLGIALGAVALLAFRRE
jgi:hypothetical protein